MSNALQWGGLLGGLVAAAQFGLLAYNSIRGGDARKHQAEAAKAHLDAEQAEASLPHIQRSLELGNVAEAVTIQQGVINGLRDHAKWQDEQLAARDSRIEELERRLAERDQKVQHLEERLDEAEAALSTARAIIDELRISRDAEQR